MNGISKDSDAQDMSEFHQRISAVEVERIWRSAADAGLLTETTRSLMVHDLARMRARIGVIRDAFPAGTLHALAIKANPLVEVLREAVGCGAGLEAASIEEVHLALAAGCVPERIVFDSPAKTLPEIAQALRLGLILNADNLTELSRIDDALQTLGSSSSIGLRINPEVGAGTISQTSVGAVGSKFGVPVSDAAAVLNAFRQYRWLSGLHMHVGSQGCPLEMLTAAAGVIDELRRRILRETGRTVQFIDVGGGLPTIYTNGQSPPSPADYVNGLRSAAGDLFASGMPLITEFGRAIQAGCGITLSRVEYVRPQQQTAVIHVGADLLLRPVYRPEDWRHEFFVLDAQGVVKQGPLAPLTIAGPLCFSGDVIARDQLLPAADVGDWIVIRDTGAYTLGMWSRHCSRGIPAVLGYDPSATTPLRVIRPAETPSDIVRFWSTSPGAEPTGG